MCEATTIALVIGGVAAAAGAYVQYDSAQFAKRQSERNAQLAEAEAVDASRRGSIAEEEHRAKVRGLLGAQRAIMGANNVVASTGTPLLVSAQTAQYGEVDAITIRNNAAREVYGLRTEAIERRLFGRQTGRAGSIQAGATVLGSGAQSYGIWRDR